LIPCFVLQKSRAPNLEFFVPGHGDVDSPQTVCIREITDPPLAIHGAPGSDGEIIALARFAHPFGTSEHD
jgi:hypothetical protein